MIDPSILPSLSKALGPGYMDVFASINNTPAAPAAPTVTGGKKSRKRSPRKSPKKRMNRRRVMRKSRK